MKLATTTGDFARYFADDEDRLKAIREAGFRYADLDQCHGADPAWRYFAPDWEEKVDRLGNTAAKLGMKFVQSHAPCGADAFGEKRDLLLRATKRSIEVCARLGIRNIVVHTGRSEEYRYDRPEDKFRYFAANKSFLEELFPVMEKTGVNVLVENSSQVIMQGKWFFMQGCEIKEFLDYCAHPLLHAVWDVGHANCEGHQYRDILDLGEDLYALHIHDNRGNGDFHSLPFTGNTDYDAVMSALVEIGYKGYFTMESGATLYNFIYWKNNESKLEHGKRFLQPPLRLQKQAEILLYEAGKYLLETYGLWEE